MYRASVVLLETASTPANSPLNVTPLYHATGRQPTLPANESERNRSRRLYHCILQTSTWSCRTLAPRMRTGRWVRRQRYSQSWTNAGYQSRRRTCMRAVDCPSSLRTHTGSIQASSTNESIEGMVVFPNRAFPSTCTFQDPAQESRMCVRHRHSHPECIRSSRSWHRLRNFGHWE
jgi:hypothetical protein